MEIGAEAKEALRRLGAVDPARPPLDRGRAEEAVMRHLDALGLPRRPAVWQFGLDQGPFGLRPGETCAAWCGIAAACLLQPYRDDSGLDWNAGEAAVALNARITARRAFQAGPGTDHTPALDLVWEEAVSRLWGGGSNRLPVASTRSRLTRLALVAPFVDAFEAGLDSCFVAADHVLLVPQPVLRIESQALHCADGPAVLWGDGARAWFWHGVRVPQAVIEDPGDIPLWKIHVEPNAEVQRVMIERFGWERYADEAGARVLDHDERWGTLFARSGTFPVDDPILFLQVVNRSPEPDGSFRRYVLPVHPQLRPIPDEAAGERGFGRAQALTALNAVASTFGMTGAEYAGRLRAES